MIATSPPESRHALDLDGLRRPDISFWCAWEGTRLVGCGALKELYPRHAEIKSMRTARAHQGRGIGAQILTSLIAEARRRGYDRLSLETGAMDFFKPARRLYRKFGFTPCAPFANYNEDPNSVFLSLALTHK
jgi:putative acetyltransferase